MCHYLVEGGCKVFGRSLTLPCKEVGITVVEKVFLSGCAGRETCAVRGHYCSGTGHHVGGRR